MIRVSGPEAFRFCRQICDRPLPGGGGHKYVRLLRSVETQEVLDEAVVSVFKTPHSYTGEDVVEFSAHGSPVIVAEILDTLYRLGIRPAKPGEFTLRAFLNQKIDLTQAEAVADLIAARTQDEVRRAGRQLRGGISESAQSISDQIVKLLSSIELEMDFVEEDVELMPKEEKRQLTSEIIGHLNQMLAGYQLSRRLREGVRIVISGAPNVGKSTLFNALTGQEKAIVHETPGTTRDVIEATSESRGVVVTYLDTAGIRITSDAVEDEGVKRARREVSKADLIIRVVSRDVPDSEPDDLAPGTETIQVVNKYDLNPAFKPEGALAISAKTGFGLDELKTKIYQLLIGAGDVNSASVSRERHYNIVTEALAAMSRAEETLNSGYTSEIIAEELRDALAAIDALTGKKRLQGLLNEIFSNFCIGK